MWFQVLLLPLSLATALPQGDGVVVREKREPSRSYMFSGWLPGSGMSTFASTGDMYPRHRGPSRHPGSWGVDSEEQPPPLPAAEAPATLPESAWRHEDEQDKDEADGGIQVRGGGEEEPVAAVTRPPRKHKKKYSPKQSEGDEEEEYERPSRRGSGGNAAASFNAWFPIMMGMYPPGGEMGGGRGDGAGGWQGAAGQGGGSRGPPGRDTHTTVIANSVSHGAHGIATSHAQVNAGSDQQRSHTS